MHHAVEYHRYDIFLPTAVEKIRAVLKDAGSGHSDDWRVNQRHNLDNLLTVFFEEQGLELDLSHMPLYVVPYSSSFYTTFLAYWLSVQPTAKAHFILDHHRKLFNGNYYYKADQFLQMIEYRLLSDVINLNFPETEARCLQIRDWIYRQYDLAAMPRSSDRLDNLYYWPYPVRKLEIMHAYLVEQGFIKPNPHFIESFRSFSVPSRVRSQWLQRKTLLVGFFYKLYGFKTQYCSQLIHTIIVKLFTEKDGIDFDPRVLNQTLLNNKYRYESGEGLTPEYKELFAFIDTLDLFKRNID